MLFDVMFLSRYGGDGATTNTRMNQRSSQLVFYECVYINWYSLAMNNVSSSVTPPSQTQPGLLAAAVPYSIPPAAAYMYSSQLVCM